MRIPETLWAKLLEYRNKYKKDSRIEDIIADAIISYLDKKEGDGEKL